MYVATCTYSGLGQRDIDRLFCDRSAEPEQDQCHLEHCTRTSICNFKIIVIHIHVLVSYVQVPVHVHLTRHLTKPDRLKLLHEVDIDIHVHCSTVLSHLRPARLLLLSLLRTFFTFENVFQILFATSFVTVYSVTPSNYPTFDRMKKTTSN